MVKLYTICNMLFPQFLQAGTQGPARHRGSSLDSNTPHGAAPALDKRQFTEEVQNMQTPDLKLTFLHISQFSELNLCIFNIE